MPRRWPRWWRCSAGYPTLSALNPPRIGRQQAQAAGCIRPADAAGAARAPPPSAGLASKLRGAAVPHSGQAQGAENSASGRIAANGPHASQVYS
jgi:hypothetical protein